MRGLNLRERINFEYEFLWYEKIIKLSLLYGRVGHRSLKIILPFLIDRPPIHFLVFIPSNVTQKWGKDLMCLHPKLASQLSIYALTIDLFVSSECLKHTICQYYAFVMTSLLWQPCKYLTILGARVNWKLKHQFFFSNFPKIIF